MHDYEDEPPPAPELEDAPLATEKTVTIELTVSPEAIIRAAVERTMNAYDRGGIHDQIAKAVREAVNERVKIAVAEMVQAECIAMTRAAIEEGLKNGFPVYDGYGSTSKNTETLAQQVRKALDANRSVGGYNEPKLNLIEYTLNQLLGKELKTVIDAEVKQLATAAREQVRNKFAHALADVLAKGT